MAAMLLETVQVSLDPVAANLDLFVNPVQLGALDVCTTEDDHHGDGLVDSADPWSQARPSFVTWWRSAYTRSVLSGLPPRCADGMHDRQAGTGPSLLDD
jgi:hypothetical protein